MASRFPANPACHPASTTADGVVHLPTSRYPQVIHKCGNRGRDTAGLTLCSPRIRHLPTSNNTALLINTVHKSVDGGTPASLTRSFYAFFHEVVHRSTGTTLFVHLRTPLSPRVIHRCGFARPQGSSTPAAPRENSFPGWNYKAVSYQHCG